MVSRLFSYADWLLGAGLSIALFCALSGPTRLWSSPGNSALFSTRHGIALAFFLALPWIIQFWRTRQRNPPRPEGFVIGLLLAFVTDWTLRGYNFFPGPTIRGELLLAAGATYAITRISSSRLWSSLALGSCLLCSGAFLIASEGRLLFSDDHGTFLFRLLLLKDNFPTIPFYSPLWNGGFDARDFFATGALNVFFFVWPLVYFTDFASTYNVAVAFLLFILTPGATYLAARLGRFTPSSCAIAAILSLSSGLLWYRWGLSYGTLGFVTSTALLPVVLVLGIRIVRPSESLTRAEAVLFVCAASLTLCWSLSAVVLLPLAIFGLFSLRSALRKPLVPLIIAALILINLPWMALFWKVSNVGHFVHAGSAVTRAGQEASLENPPDKPHIQAKASPRGIDLHRSAKILRETAVSTNPLHFLFFIPALFALPRGTRAVWAATAAWLVITGALIAPMKPQLELDRMLVILFQLSALLIAPVIAHLLGANIGLLKRSQRLVAAAVGAFLLIGPFATSSFLLGRSIMQYSFASPLVGSLVEAINSYGGSGRVLFAGFLLHEISGGHAAPLPYWTRQPLMASSPFHNLWHYKQIFPASYISRGDAGIREYLDLYNVTGIVTHDSTWQRYFRERPGEFRLAWEHDRFSFFQRINIEPSFIFSGAAKDVGETSSAVTLTPLTKEVILKFNYFPFLQASGCEVSPEVKSVDVSLIKLSNCTIGAPIEVRSQSPWSRLWLK